MTQKGREDLITFSFWCPKDLRDEVKRAAIDVGKPVQDIMAEAVEQWLERHRKRGKKG